MFRGALPVEVSKLGHSGRGHHAGLSTGSGLRPADRAAAGRILSPDRHAECVAGRLLKSQLPDSDVPVYLVEQPEYFDRPQLYREEGIDYRDNCERFVFFSRAVLEAIRLFDLKIDVLHANDWQTGLIPAYLKIEYRQTAGL